jgi:hypothetical protein
LQAILDFRRGDGGREGVAVDAQLVGDFQHHRQLADVAIIHPVGAEHGMGELPRFPAVLPVQPVVTARRSKGRDGKPGRERIGQAQEARRALDVAFAVFALERHGEQEGQAGYLERGRNHHRAPLHLAPVFRRKFVDALAGEVGVGRGKIEPEFDGLSHVDPP